MALTSTQRTALFRERNREHCKQYALEWDRTHADEIRENRRDQKAQYYLSRKAQVRTTFETESARLRQIRACP